LGHESRGTEDSKNVLFEIIYHRLWEIFRFIHSLHFNAKNIKKTGFLNKQFLYFLNNKLALQKLLWD
jgi:hypothetical protein